MVNTEDSVSEPRGRSLLPNPTRRDVAPPSDIADESSLPTR